ncbi:SGNH hydrolase domain-containing protein, partial [Streptomonospora salina]
TSEPMGSGAVPLYPSAVAAGEDIPDVYDAGCHASQADTRPDPCVYGPDDADTTVALVGDSHAAQWAPALRTIARERGWRLHTFTKSACGFTVADLESGTGGPYDACKRYNRAVLDELTGGLHPELVFTSSSSMADGYGAASPEDGRAAIAAGMNRLWSPLEDAGTDVVAIRDTPTTRTRLPECVSLHKDDLAQCEQPAEDAFSDDDPQVIAARESDAGLVDLSDRICTAGTCPPVIGNVLVYRDSHHLTATYARLLAPELEEAAASYLRGG